MNGAFHAVSWGLVYVWTSFFGLLRDDKPLNEFMVWYVALLRTCIVCVTWCCCSSCCSSCNWAVYCLQ